MCGDNETRQGFEEEAAVSKSQAAEAPRLRSCWGRHGGMDQIKGVVVNKGRSCDVFS